MSKKGASAPHMRGGELAEKVAEKTGLPKKDVKLVFSAAHDIIVSFLKKENKSNTQVTVPELFTAKLVKDSGGNRNVRNPATGEVKNVYKPPSQKVKVRPNASLKKLG